MTVLSRCATMTDVHRPRSCVREAWICCSVRLSSALVASVGEKVWEKCETMGLDLEGMEECGEVREGGLDLLLREALQCTCHL